MVFLLLPRMSRNYDHLSHQELISLLQARDRRDATKFGLVWETNEIERDKAFNGDFVALDLDPSLSCGDAPWKNLIIEGDNFDALRYLNMTFKGRVKLIFMIHPTIRATRISFTTIISLKRKTSGDTPLGASLCIRGSRSPEIYSVRTDQFLCPLMITRFLPWGC